jgi:hypothetical protein
MNCGAERRIKENTRKRKKTEEEKATRKQLKEVKIKEKYAIHSANY